MSTITTAPTTVCIGTITIEPGTTHRYDISETASRYEEVLLTPGTYEVHAGHHHLYAYEVVLSIKDLTGTVTSRYDGAEFHGVYVGSGGQHTSHPHVGRTVEVRRMPVRFDQVDLSDQAAEHLCWSWLTAYENCAENRLDGHGLKLRRQKSLRWTALVWGIGHCVRLPGELPEFFDERWSLVERVNELIADGHAPEVFQVWTDPTTRKPSFMSQRHDHLPYKARPHERDENIRWP